MAGTSPENTAIDNGRDRRHQRLHPKWRSVLVNGWVIHKDFGHIKHGLVQTSQATQSKTDDIVLAAMNQARWGRCRRNKATSPSRAAGNAA